MVETVMPVISEAFWTGMPASTIARACMRRPASWWMKPLGNLGVGGTTDVWLMRGVMARDRGYY